MPLLLPKMLSMSNAAAFALEYSLTPSSSSSSTGAQFVLADSAGPVAIHDFGKFVTTFSSKQMPKKLLLHGSDFRWACSRGAQLGMCTSTCACVCVRACVLQSPIHLLISHCVGGNSCLTLRHASAPKYKAVQK